MSAVTAAAGRPGRRALLGLAVAVLGAAAAIRFVGFATDALAGREAAAIARPGDIRMIASIGCRYCAEARAWFEANRLPFSECLIERDDECAATYRALQAPGTPVLVVRGQRLVGFDAQAVSAALRGAGDRAEPRR